MQTSNNQTSSPYIPSEAYRFFPKIDNSQHPDTPRTFFDGNIQFTFYENEMIKKFREYSAKENYTLKPIWTDNMILRFLYSHNFKISNTFLDIKEHTIWREKNLPVPVDEQLYNILNSGLLYIHGRDKEFRPVVVFNVHLIDPKKANLQLIKEAVTFWIEHVINEWMLPGQVENWVFIVDVKNKESCDVNHPTMKDLLTYLQDNHRRRLHKLHVVNVPTSLYVSWGLIKKKYFNNVTLQKTKIYKGPVPVKLLESINPEQIEQKYGGLAKNATQYWPPIIPSNNYFVAQEDSQALITEEQYISLYQSGALSNMRVSHSLINRKPVELDKQADLSVPLLGPLSRAPSVLESSSGSIAGEDNRDDGNEMMEDKIKAVIREFQSVFLGQVHSP